MCKVYFAHSFTFKMAAGTSKRLESTVSPLDNGVGEGHPNELAICRTEGKLDGICNTQHIVPQS